MPSPSRARSTRALPATAAPPSGKGVATSRALGAEVAAAAARGTRAAIQVEAPTGKSGTCDHLNILY